MSADIPSDNSEINFLELCPFDIRKNQMQNKTLRKKERSLKKIINLY
jgi:hypothetical protein